MNITPEEIHIIRQGLTAALLQIDTARFAKEKCEEALLIVEKIEKQLPSRQ